MFALNGTFIIFILLFLIFIQLLNKIMLQPVEAAMNKRSMRLKENIDAARISMQETEKVLADYQTKLHASRQQAQTLIHKAMAEAQNIREEKLKSVQAEGHLKINDMKSELEAGKKNLIESLIHPELELVRNILNKLLGETPALVTNEQRVSEVLESTR